MTKYFIISLLLCLLACTQNQQTKNIKKGVTTSKASILILGTAQDAGSPQIGCQKECCVDLPQNTPRMVSSIGIVDAENESTYLFDATPDMVAQMELLTSHEKKSNKQITDGIFLTHAHIGHYTGLMYLGKESMDVDSVPVYTMPRMKEFLSNNGPWDQLVARNNIELRTLKSEQSIQLSENTGVTPLLVPHRDEYSETVGYRIDGPRKSALFIPDIDKWDKWEHDIKAEIAQVDYAFLDATFYSGAEMNNRDITQIPHPFVIESLETFKDLSPAEKNKIIFIHFNHTNPLLDAESEESKAVTEQGYRIARVGDVFEM